MPVDATTARLSALRSIVTSPAILFVAEESLIELRVNYLAQVQT